MILSKLRKNLLFITTNIKKDVMHPRSFLINDWLNERQTLQKQFQKFLLIEAINVYKSIFDVEIHC